MVKIRCQGCGRTVEVPKDWDDTATCDECGDCFEVYGSEDDTYEESEEDEEEEEEIGTCPVCKKEMKEDADTWECEECGEESICEDCIIELESANCFYCKPCIDKAYPRESRIEYKETIVEKPVYKFIDKEGKETTKTSGFNPEAKSKFD